MPTRASGFMQRSSMNDSNATSSSASDGMGAVEATKDTDGVEERVGRGVG